MARIDQLQKILKTLTTTTPDVEAGGVVSSDGLVIASALPQGTDDDAYAAMSAALLGLGERISGELKRGDLETVLIKGSQGYVFLARCGNEAVLTVMATRQAKLGLLFLDVQRAARELAPLL